MYVITTDRPFVLIRHGQTDANRDGIIAGRLEAQLTEAGREAAEALAALPWEGPLAVFSSPQKRAHQTAALAFPEADILLHEGLRERSWGDLEGRPTGLQTPREATPPGGESWAELQARVAATITDCLTRSPRGHLTVLVAHSGIIRATRAVTGGDAGGPSPANTLPLLFAPLGGGRFQERAFFEPLPFRGLSESIVTL
jgi:broad specificity phosphatase PhoE